MKIQYIADCQDCAYSEGPVEYRSQAEALAIAHRVSTLHVCEVKSIEVEHGK